MNNAFYSENQDKNRVILTDALAQDAAEFFIATAITGIRVEAGNVLLKMQEILAEVAQASYSDVDDTRCDAESNPFIQDFIQDFAPELAQDAMQVSNQQAVMVEEENSMLVPAVKSFWTLPSVNCCSDIMTNDQGSVAPKSSSQLHCDLDRLLNCTCSDCLPAVACRWQAFSWFKLAAPALCSMLFLLLVVSIMSQLIALSERHTDQAKQLCGGGKYQESANAASLAITCNPFSSDAYCQRARALTHMLRYREAEECLNRALNFDPNCIQALDARASLSIKVGKPEQAIADTNKLLGLRGNKPNAYQYGNLAVGYYSVKNYEQAIKAYDQAVRQSNIKDGYLLSLKLGRAYCLYGQQHYKQALDACNKLSNHYGSKGDILVLSGFCNQCMHDTEAANRDFDLAIATEPTKASYYADRAAFFAEIHKQKACLNDRVKAADLNRFDARLQLDAARALVSAGCTHEAIKYYDRLSLTSSFKQSAQQQKERAKLNFEAGRYALSLNDLNRAIELAPGSDLYAMQALCFARTGQTAAARNAIAQGYSLKTEDGSILLADAKIEALLGQTVSAVDKFSQVLKANRDNKDALIGRGLCYFGRGQWASAAQDLRNAMNLGAKDQTIVCKLQKCENVLAGGAKIKLDLPRRKIIDLARVSTSDLSKNGRQATQDGDMHLATIYFTELSRRQPANVAARLNLAHAFELDGSHEEAVRVFEVLSLTENLSAPDQFCYAHALAAAGQYERSISVMERLTDGQPSNVDYKLELIKVVSAAGKLDEAIALCRQSLLEQSSSASRKSFNDVYESLITERLRGQQSGEASSKANPAMHGETEG